LFTEDGWFRTSDLGFIVDDAGNVQLSGTARKLLIAAARGSFRAKSTKILYTHPSDLHAAWLAYPTLGLASEAAFVSFPGRGAIYRSKRPWVFSSVR
jgi:acyl-CoA synthetase (AMP-forming)/AMP-acid ligase II